MPYPPEWTPYPAHADTDGVPPGEPEPVQGQPVTDDEMQRIFGLS